MAVTMKQLGLDKLSMEDRLALLGELWDSVAPPWERYQLTEEQKKLFKARMTEMDCHPDKAMSWEEMDALLKGND